jgi:hypothetical protein
MNAETVNQFETAVRAAFEASAAAYGTPEWPAARAAWKEANRAFVAARMARRAAFLASVPADL